jgi:hypothetical protein
LYIGFERFIVGEYSLGGFPGQHIDFLIIVLVSYKIVNISLDLVESYPFKVANRINYLGRFGSEQVLVEENINIHVRL